MALQVVFRAEARSELREARAWYDLRSPGLGLEFARTVDAAIETIRRYPEAYPTVESDIRRAVVRRFPYQLLYYREATEELVILACFHHRRDPDVWRSRR